MQCSRCQHENPAAQKFCGECGARLALVCPSCGASNPPAQKFCGECGTGLAPTEGTAKYDTPQSYTPKHLAEKILTSKAALEGERKMVTVLFADLKGSMELLADRDPEEARKLLDPVLEHMMEAVHRYEGTVNQVMGDGIMALFGAPLAHEDHAVRACCAALRMQESVKKYAEDVRRSHAAVVKIRVGLNSGEVVVRAIGSDLHMDYTAVGQTTHLAARMEQIADPGAIVITPETLALAEGYVEVKSLGPVPVKGLADAVEVYEVTGAGPARTRLQAATRRGLTRFVGRDVEMEQLRRAQRFAGGGRGQVAAIVGEAGVGKSRVVYEFTHSHRLQGWLVLESASVSYGKATSYLPVIDLLKGYFKIQDRDDLREIREKVTGKLLTLDESLKPTLPALLALLDVPVDDIGWQTLDPGQRRQRTLDAVKGLLLREAREQPLLVIFEDLHWIDSETQALLDALVESLGSTRLLLLVNFRPGYQHTWGSRTYYSQMRLDVLPAASAGELLEALLGDDPGLGPLKQLLVRRGNPFFLEETVQTLVETGALVGERGRYRLTQAVPTIQVPATVQVILAARIDRLAPEDKRLLQVASVVGKDVPLALLQAIAELPDDALRRGLDHLQAAEFLYETRLFPDLEYSFKHALTHEVTYSGLLQERRCALHARIVDALEMLHRDRPDERIERLAHHALRGELREKAMHYLRQAGLKAAARSALPDARMWLEQALGVLETLPESRSTLEQAFDLRIELRPILMHLGDIPKVVEGLRQAEGMAERLNDDRRRGRVCALMTNLHTQLGEMDEALVSGTRALSLAEALGDLELRLLATGYVQQQYFFRGEYERVIDLVRANLAALPPEARYERFGGGQPVSVNDRYWLVGSLASLGRFAEASEAAEEAIAIADSINHPATATWAYWGGSLPHRQRGNWAKARTLLEHCIALARQGNVVIDLDAKLADYARVLAELDETAAAMSHLQESEHLFERRRRGEWERSTPRLAADLWRLGEASLRLGRVTEAQQFAQEALDAQPRVFVAHVNALWLLAKIATHPSRFDPETGATYYGKVLAWAAEHKTRPLIAHCHLGLGKLYRRTGQREQAHEHLIIATTLYREMDMPFWLEQAEAEARELV